VAADYGQLGELLVVVLVIGVLMPFAAILIVRASGLRWA